MFFSSISFYRYLYSISGGNLASVGATEGLIGISHIHQGPAEGVTERLTCVRHIHHGRAEGVTERLNGVLEEGNSSMVNVFSFVVNHTARMRFSLTPNDIQSSESFFLFHYGKTKILFKYRIVSFSDKRNFSFFGRMISNRKI